MPTIFEKIDKKLEKMEDKATKRAKKELLYQRLTELYRGKSRFDKLIGMFKIWTA